MDKRIIWSEKSPDSQSDWNNAAFDTGGLDTARGLMIGLAISQVFWVALAFVLF